MSKEVVKSHLVILAEQAKLLAQKADSHWEGELIEGIQQLQGTLTQAKQACLQIPSEARRVRR